MNIKFENTKYDLSTLEGCLAHAAEAEEHDFVSKQSTKNSGSSHLSEEGLIAAAYANLDKISKDVRAVIDLSMHSH